MRLVQLLLGLFLVICCASSAATQSVNANPPYYITECSCKAGFRKSNCSLPTAAGFPRVQCSNGQREGPCIAPRKGTQVFTFSCSYLKGFSYFHVIVDCLFPQYWLIQRILELHPAEVYIIAPMKMRLALYHFLPRGVLQRAAFDPTEQPRCLNLLPGMSVLGMSDIKPALWDTMRPELGLIAEACRRRAWQQARIMPSGAAAAQSRSQRTAQNMQQRTQSSMFLGQQNSSQGSVQGVAPAAILPQVAAPGLQAEPADAVPVTTNFLDWKLPSTAGHAQPMNHRYVIENFPLEVLLLVRRGTQREVVNMHHLQQVLHKVFPKAHFAIFHGGETFKHMVQAFATANVSIGFHGAGSANALFAQHGALHIEMSMLAAPGAAHVTLSNERIILMHPGLTFSVHGVRFTRETVGSKAVEKVNALLKDPSAKDGHLKYFHRAIPKVLLQPEDIANVVQLVRSWFIAKQQKALAAKL